VNISSALHMFLCSALLAVPFASAQAQTKPDPLFKTIQSLDAQLFDAYNRCDLKTFAAMRDDNLELYHDPEMAPGTDSAVPGAKHIP
jgi:hypothetical protein